MLGWLSPWPWKEGTGAGWKEGVGAGWKVVGAGWKEGAGAEKLPPGW